MFHPYFDRSRHGLLAAGIALAIAVAAQGFSHGRGDSMLGAHTELSVGPLYADGAVWQRGAPIEIRGTARAMSAVTLTSASFGESLTAADSLGHWTIQLGEQPAGGPHAYTLSSGGATLSVGDVYIGDVFLCAGQSNMEWPVDQTLGAAAALSDTDALIRHLLVPHRAAAVPQRIPGPGVWQSVFPGRTDGFTAVGYYFAKAIREREPGVAIGIVNASWGGSRIEAWLADASPAQVDTVAAAARAHRVDALRARYPEAFEPGGRSLSPGEVTGETFPVGATWESSGWADIDGKVWFDRYVDLSARQIGEGMWLNLGAIDDSDWTYVNGQLVGTTQRRYDAMRRYRVPAAALKPGRNTVSVLVEDTGGGGGLTGPRDSLYLATAAGRLSLDKGWSVRPEQLTHVAITPPHHTPSALYHGMLAPLLGFKLRGMIWYQGESNAGTPEDASAYARQLRSLVADVRALTAQPSLPFVAVELPEFGQASPTAIEANGHWAQLRQSTRAIAQLPAASSVVTFGYGDEADIHPRRKRPVGELLAAEMARLTYGAQDVARFPVAVALEARGPGLVLRFDGVGIGLRSGDGAPLRGFAVRDAGGAWHFAHAEILSSDMVRIVGPAGKSIDAVAYAWANNPAGVNLVGGAGLPVGSFMLTTAE